MNDGVSGAKRARHAPQRHPPHSAWAASPPCLDAHEVFSLLSSIPSLKYVIRLPPSLPFALPFPRVFCSAKHQRQAANAVKGLSGAAAVWFAASSIVSNEGGAAAPTPPLAEAGGPALAGGAAAETAAPPPPTAVEDPDIKAAKAAAEEAMKKASAAMFKIASSEYAGQLSVGALAGFCSGYALKKVGKVAAFVGGLAFIGFQVARYNGVVKSPDWKAVDKQFVAALDANGDGKVDMEDVSLHLQKLQAYLSVGLPSSTAFGIAFILGLRYG